MVERRELYALAEKVSNWQWFAVRGVYQGLSSREVLTIHRRLCREVEQGRIGALPLKDTLAVLASGGDSAELKAALRDTIKLLEHPAAIERGEVAGRLVDLSARFPWVAKRLANGLTSSAYRTVRQQGFKIVLAHRLPGFRAKIRKELSDPCIWVAMASIDLLDPIELQTMAGELWSLGRRQVQERLLVRGVSIPVEWIDRDCQDHVIHWAICRCLVGAPPDRASLRDAIEAMDSVHQVRAMMRALARTGLLELTEPYQAHGLLNLPIKEYEYKGYEAPIRLEKTPLDASQLSPFEDP